jgi:hypothetical protein
MDTELFIGNTRADINEDITVEYSLNDIRNFESGSQQSSYDIDLPLTPVNKLLIKYNHELNVKEEITEIAKIKFKDTEVFKGKVQQVNSKLSESKIIIKGNYWADAFKTLKLKDLDFTAYDHIYNTTNIQASWIAGIGTFYRYPLVMFAGLGMGSTQWYATDFIPWFNIREVLLKIFEHYTIVSSFLQGDYFKNLYFLSRESIAENGFLDGKEFDVKVNDEDDNEIIQTIEPGNTESVVLTINHVSLLNTITDEGDNFEVGQHYIIPETGTYRFQFIVHPTVFSTDLTVTNPVYTFSIRKDDVAVATTSGTTVPSGIYILDTGYMHFIKNELITCYMHVSLRAYNGTANNVTCTIRLETTTEFKNIVNAACLLIGTGKTLTIADWMPDCTQADFISAVKHLFNLHFFMDDWNKTIYIEPEGTWHTDNEVDLGDAIEQKDIEVELISPNYGKNIYLEFKEDTQDVYMKEVNLQLKTIAGQKLVSLLSEYAKNEDQKIINPLFSTFIVGNLPIGVGYGPDVAKIFLDYDHKTLNYPDYRGGNYSMKVGSWGGMTAGDNWIYETVTKTTYPAITPLDFATLYPLYYLKTFHYIDGGKLAKLKIRPELNFLQQFVTVIIDSQYEGFRASYRFTVGDENYMGILNRITFNGPRAILELIIK